MKHVACLTYSCMWAGSIDLIITRHDSLPGYAVRIHFKFTIIIINQARNCRGRGQAGLHIEEFHMIITEDDWNDDQLDIHARRSSLRTWDNMLYMLQVAMSRRKDTWRLGN
jgi:hypothetical protein